MDFQVRRTNKQRRIYQVDALRKQKGKIHAVTVATMQIVGKTPNEDAKFLMNVAATQAERNYLYSHENIFRYGYYSERPDFLIYNDRQDCAGPLMQAPPQPPHVKLRKKLVSSKFDLDFEEFGDL